MVASISQLIRQHYFQSTEKPALWTPGAFACDGSEECLGCNGRSAAITSTKLVECGVLRTCIVHPAEFEGKLTNKALRWLGDRFASLYASVFSMIG